MLYTERPEQCSGMWPLTSWEINVLEANHRHLVEHIDASNNELINELYSVGFLNKRQRDHVIELVHNSEKVAVLLDILHNSSLSNYRKMKICLLKTKQEHNAWILEKGSGKKILSFSIITF